MHFLYSVGVDIFIFVSFEGFFTKRSGIDPCEKHINILGGHAWRGFYFSTLEAMAM